MSLLQYFRAFDRDIVSSLCSWTRTRDPYYFRYSPTSDPHRFIGRRWVTVTEDDMYVLIASQLLMGLNHLPSIVDYWAHNIIVSGTPVLTGPVIGRICKYYASFGSQIVMTFVKVPITKRCTFQQAVWKVDYLLCSRWKVHYGWDFCSSGVFISDNT